MSRSSEIARADREDRQRWGVVLHKDRRGNPVFGQPWGTPSRAAFRAWLPKAPLGYCTRERAAIYARDIDQCLEEHRDELTRSEQSKLYALRKVWRRRAAGEDARFESMQGVFGGLTERHRLAQGLSPADCLAKLRALVMPELNRQPSTDIFDDTHRYGPKAKTSRVDALERMKRSLGVK